MASLATLRRAAAHAWRRSRDAFRFSRSARIPFKRKPLFEALEPRVLLSADFNPVAPAGSMVYASTQTGTLASAGPDVSYTLSLDAGQKVSVALVAQDPALRASIRLLAPDGTLLGSADAPAAGYNALLDSISGADAGDYSLVFHDLEGAGNFKADIYLNATREAESVIVATNDDIPNAQSLAPSEISLPGGGKRYAALGTTEAAAADFYDIELAEGDTATFGLAPTVVRPGSALHLELQDANGALIALGETGAKNFDQTIRGFVAPATGTYNLKVTGNGGEQYALVAYRNVAPDLEPNNNASQASPLSPLNEALGGLGGAGGELRVAVVNDRSGNNSGLQAIVAQLNDSTEFSFNATLVAPSAVDTLAELSAYNVVVIGGTGYDNNQFFEFAAALRPYVEGGGGLITTGWGIYASGGLGGTTRTDFDAVVPVNTGAYNYVFGPTITPTGSHPITDGVASFNVSTYVEYPYFGIDTGSTLLATGSGVPVAVSAEIANGRSVYLGPVYAGGPGYDVAALRSGDADRLLEQAVVWVGKGGGDAKDHYTVAANAG